jgi:hypothetical protein
MYENRMKPVEIVQRERNKGGWEEVNLRYIASHM